MQKCPCLLSSNHEPSPKSLHSPWLGNQKLLSKTRQPVHLNNNQTFLQKELAKLIEAGICKKTKRWRESHI